MIKLRFTDEEKINKEYIVDLPDEEGLFCVDWDSVRYEEPYWLYFVAIRDDGEKWKKVKFEVKLENSLTEEEAKDYSAGELIRSGWDNYIYVEV